MNQQPPKIPGDGPKPGHWDEIPWPISGHQPHFTMPEALYKDLVKEFPSVNVEQELLSAYEYMKQRFPGASEAEFCKFILNWMHRNERLNRKVNKLNNPDNVSNPWMVNYEARQRNSGKLSLVEQVEQANAHILYPKGAGAIYDVEPEGSGESVFDHDGAVRAEVDECLRSG